MVEKINNQLCKRTLEKSAAQKITCEKSDDQFIGWHILRGILWNTCLYIFMRNLLFGVGGALRGRGIGKRWRGSRGYMYAYTHPYTDFKKRNSNKNLTLKIKTTFLSL